MPINAQTLEGSWNEIKGKVRERWGQVTNDDLQKVHGNVDQLVGLIERKTGEARQQVEKFLSELTADGASSVNKVVQVAKEYASDAASSVEGTISDAGTYVRDGYEATERMVRQRPLESLAVGFGTGLIAGVVIGLLLKAR